jgi:hypothetical protein
LLNTGLLDPEERRRFQHLLRSYRSREDGSLTRLIEHAETQLRNYDEPK